MTQEIKDRLEQAADALFEHKGYSFTPCDYAMRKGFLAGAQTILENPSEYGLEYSTQTFKDALAAASQHAMENELLKSQLTKYREALDKVHKIVMYDLSEPIQEIIDVVEGVLYEGE